MQSWIWDSKAVSHFGLLWECVWERLYSWLHQSQYFSLFMNHDGPTFAPRVDIHYHPHIGTSIIPRHLYFLTRLKIAMHTLAFGKSCLYIGQCFLWFCMSKTCIQKMFIDSWKMSEGLNHSVCKKHAPFSCKGFIAKPRTTNGNISIASPKNA